nr:uncharacterized protein LOC127490304 isoform X1 [Oryctolagus cuniculus]
MAKVHTTTIIILTTCQERETGETTSTSSLSESCSFSSYSSLFSVVWRVAGVVIDYNCPFQGEEGCLTHSAEQLQLYQQFSGCSPSVSISTHTQEIAKGQVPGVHFRSADSDTLREGPAFCWTNPSDDPDSCPYCMVLLGNVCRSQGRARQGAKLYLVPWSSPEPLLLDHLPQGWRTGCCSSCLRSGQETAAWRDEMEKELGYRDWSIACDAFLSWSLSSSHVDDYSALWIGIPCFPLPPSHLSTCHSAARMKSELCKPEHATRMLKLFSVIRDRAYVKRRTWLS